MTQQLADIYARHGRALYALALSRTRCPQRAEDAVQEAFEHVLRRGRLPEGKAEAYVFAAVRNAAIDQLRRAPREVSGELPPALFDGRPNDPATAAMDAEVQQELRSAVEGLPEDQREAVIMRVYAGLTFQQAAEITGEPIGTLNARYRRALATLQQRCRRLQ